jgi:hypothetical protein
VKQMINKTFISFWLCYRTLGITWGLKSKIVHWLYTGTIWPRLIYMTTVWWRRVGLATFRVEHLCLQRLACASIAGFVSRDLTAFMEVFGLPL